MLPNLYTVAIGGRIPVDAKRLREKDDMQADATKAQRLEGEKWAKRNGWWRGHWRRSDGTRRLVHWRRKSQPNADNGQFQPEVLLEDHPHQLD